MSKHVWVIDDDHAIRWVLDRALAQAGIPITAFDSADEAMHHLPKETPSGNHHRYPHAGHFWVGLLAEFNKQHPNIPVIVMTAHSDLQSAVTSFERGAFEYLPKPFDVDDAVAVVQRAIAHSEEQDPVVVEQMTPATEIIGQAPAMQEVFRAIGRLSFSNVSVLINGPSGSGKGVGGARAARHSPRSSEPVYCFERGSHS